MTGYRARSVAAMLNGLLALTCSMPNPRAMAMRSPAWLSI